MGKSGDDGALTSDGTLTNDGAVSQDGSMATDGGAGLDARPWPDAGYGPCDCQEHRPAYQYHPCVPPLQAFCYAVECTPGENDCPEGYSCDQWGAANCCQCAGATPACVFTGPAQGPLPEVLKITPTVSTAGQALTFSVQGFPFYVGALYYLVRVGASGDLFESGGGLCSIEVQVPGQDPGMVPVWVSQYGGNEPWVLAGFLTWSAGATSFCTQPGYPCGPELSSCCETHDVPMACLEGRCRRP